MAQIKQSITKTVKRSQINLNALNPKRHLEEAIKTQARNIKKVGILGGIVLNSTTSNLLDGHRRLLALDQLNKYDGTPETDYDVKVEVCALSEKEEKEQMTYMAVGNTQADLDLIAKYIGDIDTKDIGLTDAQIKALEQFNITEEDIFQSEDKGSVSAEVEDFFNFLPTTTAPVKGSENLTEEEKKAKVLEGKNLNKENSERYDESAASQIIISFDCYENKIAFCETFALDPDIKIVKGETILEKL
jgi:hypothetical protein